jgi:hypothetical protein
LPAELQKQSSHERQLGKDVPLGRT